MFTDTHATVKRLEKAGFSTEQAEALAEEHETMAEEIVRNIREGIRAEFAPQFDSIRAELANVRNELRAEIHAVARDQLFKIVPMFLSLGGLVLAGIAFIITRML